MESELKGKVVLVTGASGGIGSAIARAFAREGARVVLHYRSGRGRVNGIAREIGEDDSLTMHGEFVIERPQGSKNSNRAIHKDLQDKRKVACGLEP